MSRAEVEAILGPPGDYRTGPAEPDTGLGPVKVRVAAGHTAAVWRGDSALVTIEFGGPRR